MWQGGREQLTLVWREWGNFYVDCSFGYYEWTINKVVKRSIVEFPFYIDVFTGSLTCRDE
jgi:hypothetical protein